MTKILIVYGTSYGQTAKVAQHVGSLPRCFELSATIARADRLPRGLAVDEYDAVLIGASINFGRYQRSVARFIADHSSALNRVPSAFFSVSGTRPLTPRLHARAQRLAQHFVASLGWRPVEIATFAGAAAYTRYPLRTRWLILAITALEHGPTDTHRDHEFTDWSEVGAFAGRMATRIAPPVAHMI